MLFKKGEEVLLIETNHRPYRNNPLIGTKYECKGKVIGFQYGNNSIIIKWKNGYTNAHESSALLRVNSSSEGYKSIW